jgi:endonuclease III related protein
VAISDVWDRHGPRKAGGLAMTVTMISPFNLLEIYRRLYRCYGPQHWWPAKTSWEMMAGAILTQNTSWTNVERAIGALKDARALSIRKIARMPRRRLEQLIRPSGYFRQKAKRLQKFARVMKNDRALFRKLSGQFSASPGLRRPLLHRRGIFDRPLSRQGEGWGEAELRVRLLSLHGIGPETADSILLYAGGYPVFVVDAYTRRLGQRLGLFKTDDYQIIQNYFQENSFSLRAGSGPRPYDDTARLYNEFHALIVRHAKEVCVSRNPKCSICPLRQICPCGINTPSPAGKREKVGMRARQMLCPHPTLSRLPPGEGIRGDIE